MERRLSPVRCVRLLAALTAALALAFPGAVSVAQSHPAPTPSRSTGSGRLVQMLPDQLPTDLPGGTIDTPLGKARWVHLTGDPTSLPGPLQPTIGPSSLVWFDFGGDMSCPSAGSASLCGTSTAARLWTSDDAVSARTEHALPVAGGVAGFEFEGDTYWLTTTDPVTLWRSSDLTTWDQVDVSALVSPGPTGLTWGVELGTPVSSRGVSLLPVTYHAQDLGRLVGFPGRSVFLEAAGPGRYAVKEYHSRRDGGDKVIGTVSVETTPTGIRFSDDAGGTIAQLSGVGLAFVEAWASRGSIDEHQLAIVDGSTLTAVTDPGMPLNDPSGEGPILFPIESGFQAFQVDTDSTVRTWRSGDGRSWQEGERLLAPDGQPMKAQEVNPDWLWGQHDITVTPLADPKAAGPPHDWRSVDGVNWTAVPPMPNGEDGLVFQVPGGSLRLADDGSWSTSTDGVTWVDVPGLRQAVTKWTPDGAGSDGGSVVGDALFFSVDEMEGSRQRDLWIIEFVPGPSQ